MEKKLEYPIAKLITFAGGAIFNDAADRLIEQSQEFEAIDDRKILSEKDLKDEYNEMFEEQVRKNPTGYGLYSWKPYLIYSELKKLRQNDILIYIDAGCELNKYGRKRLNDYLSYTSENEILIFEQQQPNKIWTKEHAKLSYPEYFHRNSVVAGVIFLKRTEKSMQLVKSWLDLCSYKKGLLLREPLIDEPQHDHFKAHRHDQACLSICTFIHNIKLIKDETWFEDFTKAREYPILALRNKSRKTMLNFYLNNNFFKLIKKFIKICRPYNFN